MLVTESRTFGLLRQGDRQVSGGGRKLFMEWWCAAELGQASMRIDGPGAVRRGTLWSTYEQPKRILTGPTARRLTLWSCWSPRVQRLLASCGVGMLENGNVRGNRVLKNVELDEN